MKVKRKLSKIGILGCGAIGSGIAKRLCRDFNGECELAAIYDIDYSKMVQLERSLPPKNMLVSSFDEFLRKSDFIVEAVNAADTQEIIETILKAGKDILCMSVGKLFKAQHLFELARRNHCQLLLPSGAIAGVDAIKAASLAKITKISLTTRKPLAGFRDNVYLKKNGIRLDKIKKETIIYSGDVDGAVKYFPQNINVAATIALASKFKKKLNITLMTSPTLTTNIHEIELHGDFGRILTRTENVVVPDNPKTSYLAVLSGLQSLKQYCAGVFIGT